MKKILLCLIASLLLFSCSTTRDVINLPSWIENPPTIPLSTVYVGEGEGESEEDARKNALLNVLERLGEETDFDYVTKYYREFFSTSKIVDFGTEISSEFSYERDGTWYYYIFSVSNTSLLTAVRSEDYLKRAEIKAEIAYLLDEALELYKNNKDVSAINKMLEALDYSLDSSLDLDDYSPHSILDTITTYLSRLSIRYIPKSKKYSSFMTFEIVRKRGIFYPGVEEGDVEIFYSSLSPDCDILTLSYLGRTDDRGYLAIEITNPNTIKRGGITIRIRLNEKLLSSIEKKGGEEFIRPIYDALEETSFTKDYTIEHSLNIDETLIALVLYDTEGDRLNSSFVKEEIERVGSLLVTDVPRIVDADGEDEESVLSFISSNYSDYKYIFVIRIGIVDRILSLDKYYSRGEGRVIKLDNTNSEAIEEDSIEYVSSSFSAEEADKSVITYLTRIISSSLLSEY